MNINHIPDKTVSRLILKEKDVLVLYLPKDYFRHKDILISIYKQIKESLHDSGKKNKILVMPNDIKLGVIGEKQIDEHVSNIDLWHLFDDEGG